MQAKCGCRILSLEMRRLVVFTRFWPRTFILGFIQTVMSSTASGLILYCINNRCTINSLYLELPCCVPVRCISPSFLLMSKHVILISPAVSNPFYWSRPLACATFDGVCKHSWTLLHITHSHTLSLCPTRRVDQGWPCLCLEGRGSSSVCGQPQLAGRIHLGNYRKPVLWCEDCYRQVVGGCTAIIMPLYTV